MSTYIGLAVAFTVVLLGLARQDWEVAGTPLGALPRWAIVGFLAPLLGSAVGGILYLLLRRWRQAGRVHLLHWRLLCSTSLVIFALGLLVLLPVGAYNAYRRYRSLPAEALGEPATPERPNIIWITIDSLRDDFLGSYGHDPGISPHMDALAGRGVRFEQAIAQSSWTLTSVGSFYTSLYPTELQIGCVWGSGFCPDRVDEYRTTLTELAQQAGYHTAAYLASPWCNEYYGLLQGLDEVVYPQLAPFDLGVLLRRPIVRLFAEFTHTFKIAFGQGYNLFVAPSFPGVDGGELLNYHALSFMEQHRDERFLLWLFYMDVHNPYNPPQAYRPLPEGFLRERERYLRTLDHDRLVSNGPLPLTLEDLPVLVSLYEGGIVYTDQLVGEIVQKVDELGLTDRTLIVLHADHGEEFLDRGNYSHGIGLYQELLHVPLIMAGPRFPGRAGSCRPPWPCWTCCLLWPK